MAPRNRALFAFVGLCSAIAAGCSGGGKSGSTPPTPTSSPSTVPTTRSSSSPTASASTTPFVLDTATPIPAATAPPTGAANSVSSRPLANGDVFQYSGTSTQTFVYTGTTPTPSSSTTTTITQKTTVATGKTFNGTSNLDAFTTAETDATARQTTTIATNTYYALGTPLPANTTTGIQQQPLTLYGSTSSASSGETVSTTLTSPSFSNNSGTVDLLPEETTPTWTNGIAETYVQNESDGFAATRTYNADGSYTENDTYPQSTAASPQPSAETATIVQKSDGSGSYSVPLFSGSNVDITYAAPTSAGLILITFTDSSGDNFVEQVSAWFPQPLSSSAPAYSEIDRDNGAVTYPSACNIGTGTEFGTTGNEVEQKFRRIDTILGDLEFFDQLTFVASNGVAACVQLSDVTYTFYDYSGQTNTDLGPGFQGGNMPYQTTTVTTTLGITGSPTLNSVARGTDAVFSGASAAGLSASAVANARANFLTTVDHYRALRERNLFAHVRASLARLHR